MLPTIDISNLNSNLGCYIITPTSIVGYNQGYKYNYVLINDKLYLSDITQETISTSEVCHTFDEINNIPASYSWTAPFYSFLCVVIFAILCWIPYKIFLKPVMPRL